MASLESVRAKLFRARQHYDAFSSEADRIIRSKNGPFIVEVDPITNRVRDDLDLKPLPSVLPMIVGDCIQNLRSSLDYVVWELALAAGVEPCERHAFPVCAAPDGFKDIVSRRKVLDGLSEDMIAEIEFLQPYKDGDLCNGHPFWVLSKLCNVNKHRRILLVRLTADYAGKPVGSERYALLSPGVSHGTYEDVGLTAFIALQEPSITNRVEVGSLMSHLIQSVEQVLPNFSRFFS